MNNMLLVIVTLLCTCAEPQTGQIRELTFSVSVYLPERLEEETRWRMARRKVLTNLPTIFTNLGRDLADVRSLDVSSMGVSQVHDRPDLFAR
jgi:hypothetical protein